MIRIIKIIFFLLFLINSSSAEIYKLGKLKIELFDQSKLIKTSGGIKEGFGEAKIRIFAEKTNDNKIKSIITTVKYKGDKYGSDMRMWWIDYFFKNKKGIFYNNGFSNLNLTNDNFTNGVVVRELNLKDYLNEQDEFKEFKSTIKRLRKKHNVDLPDRIIRADHIYIKGGDLIWVGHMFNYDQMINENVFVDKTTKFDPNIINNYPNYKKKMNQWVKLTLKRHQEFQETLKINKKINLKYENFDIKKEFKIFNDKFYLTEFNYEKNLNTKNKENEKKIAEQKANKAAEQKTKEVFEEKNDVQKSLSVEEIMTKIKDLNEMYKSGLISKEEFELLKSKLLNNN
tara:strand:+ start:180 stop:1205 length:1026 start_codon:yes stop_codon:yes gene_type:complete